MRFLLPLIELSSGTNGIAPFVTITHEPGELNRPTTGADDRKSKESTDGSTGVIAPDPFDATFMMNTGNAGARTPRVGAPLKSPTMMSIRGSASNWPNRKSAAVVTFKRGIGSDPLENVRCQDPPEFECQIVPPANVTSESFEPSSLSTSRLRVLPLVPGGRANVVNRSGPAPSASAIRNVPSEQPSATRSRVPGVWMVRANSVDAHRLAASS